MQWGATPGLGAEEGWTSLMFEKHPSSCCVWGWAVVSGAEAGRELWSRHRNLGEKWWGHRSGWQKYKWWDVVELWLILKIKQTAFPDGLDVGCEKREESRMTTRLSWLKRLEGWSVLSWLIYKGLWEEHTWGRGGVGHIMSKMLLAPRHQRLVICVAQAKECFRPGT